MKKIIGLAGSMKKRHSSSEYLLSVALEAAAEQGVQTELLRLNDYNILPCDGCGNCMNGKHCHLLKDPEDQLTELYDKLKEADGFVFASPVYALSLPAVWKNWIDRCEPCSDEDLDFEYYNYDRVAGVKGKAFKGKVAGQIVVAAGPGNEWALASLMPCFTAIKLSMIASAGISLIEYDGQPGIRKRSWSKPIEEAEEAKMMARAVGMRVASSLGFSYFDLPGQSGGVQVNGDPGRATGRGKGWRAWSKAKPGLPSLYRTSGMGRLRSVNSLRFSQGSSSSAISRPASAAGRCWSS